MANQDSPFASLAASAPRTRHSSASRELSSAAPTPQIAVVIPCYRVSKHIRSVVAAVGPEVSFIIVVDDCCPEFSSQTLITHCNDPRLVIIRHATNGGVGAAMKSGYRKALELGADIVVKLDGDGQMDPALIPMFTAPIARGDADYVKGNRFYALDFLLGMPKVRLFGNAVLSFVSKAASGYWNLMDPTNGFTAIHSAVLAALPLDKIDNRYFFESDMLVRLNTIRAVVHEIPMRARYQEEESNLRIGRIVFEFPFKFLGRFFKRIFYSYFLRDFNVCSMQLVMGLLLVTLGAAFGFYHWYQGAIVGIPASTGTVMLAALPVILGFQLLLAAISFDTMNIPRQPVHISLAGTLRSQSPEVPQFERAVGD